MHRWLRKKLKSLASAEADSAKGVTNVVSCVNDYLDLLMIPHLTSDIRV